MTDVRCVERHIVLSRCFEYVFHSIVQIGLHYPSMEFLTIVTFRYVYII
jgi:hypothetical protein